MRGFNNDADDVGIIFKVRCIFPRDGEFLSIFCIGRGRKKERTGFVCAVVSSCIPDIYMVWAAGAADGWHGNCLFISG